MNPFVELSSQDWYRVRRGEDEIAWGKIERVPGLPNVVFSRRGFQELGFLEPGQEEAVLDLLRGISDSPTSGPCVVVACGGGRRVGLVASLRVVYQPGAEAGQVAVSTIRGGAVCDPENVGPAPDRRR